MRNLFVSAVLLSATLGLLTPAAHAQLLAPKTQTAVTTAHGGLRRSNALEYLYTCTSQGTTASSRYISKFGYLNTSIQTSPETAGFDSVQAGLFLTPVKLVGGDTISFKVLPIQGQIGCDTGPFVFAAGTADGVPASQLAGPATFSPTITGPDSKGYFTFNGFVDDGSIVTQLGVLTTNGGDYFISAIRINGFLISPNVFHHIAFPRCVFGNNLDDVTYIDDYCGN